MKSIAVAALLALAGCGASPPEEKEIVWQLRPGAWDLGPAAESAAAQWAQATGIPHRVEYARSDDPRRLRRIVRDSLEEEGRLAETEWYKVTVEADWSAENAATEALLLHEMGHVMGLPHADAGVMCWAVQGMPSCIDAATAAAVGGVATCPPDYQTPKCPEMP